MPTFVVSADNEEALLGRTLTALDAVARACGEPFEVIVAGDASGDRTAAIAHAHGARVVSVRHRPIAATRNARAASGDWLVFVDADTVVTPEAVRAAVAALCVGAAGGGCASRFDGRLPLCGRLAIAAAVPLDRLLGLASGCSLFCTRPAFEAAGGFDERLSRHGRFVVLRGGVTTSGRKLRTHSAREVLGPRALCRREGLDLWYGPRRTPRRNMVQNRIPRYLGITVQIDYHGGRGPGLGVPSPGPGGVP